MEDNKDIFDEFGKRKKPSVPEGFFDSFSDNLMSKISSEEGALDSITKSNKPEIPVGFFEKFSEQIVKEVSPADEKPARIISLKVMGFVTAVAACLLVMFYIMPSDGEAELAEAEAEETESEVNLAETVTDDEYLAFLDGDDVIDFILDNEDIAIEEEITSEEEEDVFYYLEEDLEDMYLDEL